MKRTIVAIGGGELRAKTTNKIDKYIADLAKARAGEEKRANALFFPTASYDSLPYFNTFRKTYTSDFNLKVDVALLTKKNMSIEKIEGKIKAADMIYVGGGNTRYMLEVWQKLGVDKMILDAYQKGTILSGLSAGAICWFSKMYSDSDIIEGTSNSYKLYTGLGVIEGLVCPHYDDRVNDFDSLIEKEGYPSALAIENNSAVVIQNEKIIGSLTSGGKAYYIDNSKTSGLRKNLISSLEK